METIIGGGFYVLGLAVGFVLSYRERKQLRAEILRLEAELDQNHEQINRYYENPQEFLEDVEIVRAVTGAPTYGAYGKLVDDPKTAISLN